MDKKNGVSEKVLTADIIKDVARGIIKEYGFLGATLFGSYATENARPDSDVDIFVQVPEGTKTKRVFEFAYDLGEALGAEVDAYGSHEVPPESRLFRQIVTYGVAI